MLEIEYVYIDICVTYQKRNTVETKNIVSHTLIMTEED